MPKKYNIKPKERHKALVSKILENLGNGKTVGEMLKELGYKESMCKNPQMVTATIGFKKASEEIVKLLTDEIKNAILHLPKVRDKAGYVETARVIADLQKLVELLSGKPTERSEDNVNIKELPPEMLDIYLKSRLKK